MYVVFAFLACLSGMFASYYIYIKKKRHQKLACPREEPCGVVIHSHYSYTLGVPNELLGLLYFLLILIALIIFVTVPVVPKVFNIILGVVAIVGGLFSIYFVFLQAFILRKWCEWCLVVAISNFILITSIYLILR